MIYGGMAALLLVVAAVASWLPARRAAHLEPVEVLRQQ
jgi:ABC-type lipoprotein release transport system permease subunit